MQEIIAISVVFCRLLVILQDMVKLTKGGETLLMSSIVQETFLGSSILTSCLHQLLLCSMFKIFWGSLIVSQHGPFIFRFKINNSSIDY